ncbi:MAG TPA: hypothetical protein VEC39_05205 [Vicinamibacterales bacterium]|nr:hypothetical protein [Vicinamibacterales bacterium]
MTTRMRSIAVRALQRHYAAAVDRNQTIANVPLTQWPDRQLEALKVVWADAVADVPYYRHLVASGRAPATITTWADVRAIPELTREAFQRNPDAFVRRSGAPLTFLKTAGSTGTPIRVGINQAERDLMRIVKVSAWQGFGYTPDSRLFLIWGHSHLLGTGWRGRVNHATRKLRDAVLGYHRVDAYRLSEAICRDYADEILRIRPLGVIGYAAALDLFAKYTADYRQRFHDSGIRFVLSTSEPPPRPDSVARLEDLFGCPVVQEYGGAEFGQVAFKIGSQPFAVYHDLNYLEAVAGDAEAALVTALYPRYVPLIRYRVGDALIAPSRLDNGHVWQFEGLAGRINDVLPFADGSAVHSVAVFHCIHQEPSVHTIQLVLEDSGIQVRLVAEPGSRASAEQRIRARLAQVHPAFATAVFHYDDDVQTTRAGKRRWFIDRRGRHGDGAA